MDYVFYAAIPAGVILLVALVRSLRKESRLKSSRTFTILVGKTYLRSDDKRVRIIRMKKHLSVGSDGEYFTFAGDDGCQYHADGRRVADMGYNKTLYLVSEHTA